MKTAHAAQEVLEAQVVRVKKSRKSPLEDETYCEGCVYEFDQSVPPEGLSTAKVMLVGEAPAKVELEKMRPFVGDTGHLLTRYLRIVGKHRRDVFLTNICKCQVKDKSDLKKVLINRCGQYLLWEIRKYKPTLVVAMGKPAISFFVKGSPSVLSVRGRMFYSELAGTHVLCTYHPAAVMRDWSYEKLILKDLETAFNFVENPNVKVKEAKHKIVRDLDEAISVCKYMQESGEFVFDVETDSLDWMIANILSFGFSAEECTGVTIPFTSIHSTPFSRKERGKLLEQGIKPALASPAKKIGHNIGFDMHICETHNIPVNAVHFDTLLGHHLLDENFPVDLETLADFHTDLGLYDEELKSFLPNKQTSYNVVPDEVLWLYGAKDADAEYRLKVYEEPRLKAEGLEWIFRNISMPLIPVINRIERRGVHINKDGFAKAIEESGKRLDFLESSMREISGYGELFNPRSNKQIQHVLFDSLDLEVIKRTKTGPSTDVHVLEELKGRHVFVDYLMEHRKLAKFKGTYLDGTAGKEDKGLINRIRADGRIHTQYLIFGTTTGRLSSRHPNLQNIPRGPAIRDLFIARPGYKLIVGDFERGELYAAARMSGDIALKRVLKKEDVHREFAAKMLHKSPEEITYEERVSAKTVVFGILYGRGAASIARQLNVPYREALKLIIEFFDAFPQLEAWVKRTHEYCKAKGFVRSLFGRRRHLYGIFSVTGYKYGEILRQAQNMPVQGTLADIGHLATIEIDHEFLDRDLPAGFVLLVHDEMVVEAREDVVEEAKQIIRDAFERDRKGVSIPVELLVGDAWSIKGE